MIRSGGAAGGEIPRQLLLNGNIMEKWMVQKMNKWMVTNSMTDIIFVLICL